MKAEPASVTSSDQQWRRCVRAPQSARKAIEMVLKGGYMMSRRVDAMEARREEWWRMVQVGC